MSLWNDTELIELFQKKIPLIDVRAPKEFADGAIPGSVNLPIMENEERALVGTCYKEHGQSAAIELGHKLISGDVKASRIKRWAHFLEQNPHAEVFCFRGGLRSQISCQWISENGFTKTPINGGYKRLRNFFLSCLNEAPIKPIIRLGGNTGSGKTRVLRKLTHFIDLEEIANHRGSAFGPRGPQPAQISFENLLAKEILSYQGKTLILEDESATIGKVAIPVRLFKTMRASPIVVLEVSPEERLENIFHDYVKHQSADFFINGLARIQKKLGLQKCEELAQEIRKAFLYPIEIRHHETWIMTLLRDYYDPLYQKDIQYNQDKILFRGNESEVMAFLKTQ